MVTSICLKEIMKAIIYYFTGTGNSLKIAKDIAAGIPGAEVRHIAAAMTEGNRIPVVAEKVGIVFPVYVEGLPIIVERFVRSLELKPDTYVFAVANYGESAGGSLVQLEQILQEKGCRLSAAFGLKMPDNTQILFPPSSEDEQQRDFKQESKAVTEISRTVLEGTEAGVSLVQSARRRPKSIWQRPDFDPAKMVENFSADKKCDGCGICADVCSVGNVEMKDSRPLWRNHCEQCLACMQWCPRQAIQFSKKTSTWGRYHHPDVRLEELLRSW